MHQSTPRREDGPLLVGRGTFIDGLRVAELEGAAHAVFVRSIEPHALLLSIDVTAAAGMPGVLAVFVGAELGIWPLPPRLPPMNQAMLRPMLAEGRVRFVGEPVAVVVATSSALATDAAEAVIVDYEPLPVVSTIEEALSNTTILHPDAGTNVSMLWETKVPEIDPFASCDVTVQVSVRHPRLVPGPIEPRAGAAVWGADGRCTTWVCSQRPAGAKYVIECSLGLEPGTVRAIAPDVGGGFGAKGGYGCYPEDVVIVWAARRLGRAVRWCETRSEAMVAMGHGRASTHRVRIGGTLAGRILAYSVDALQDSGAYPAMGTNVTTNLRNSGTGVYDIAACTLRGTSVVTNTTPTVAFRGAGRPEAACDIERAVDMFAASVGIDPVEVRLQNVVGPDAFPYRNAVGATYDSGRYGEALTRCITAGGYEALRVEQAERRRRSDPVQLGIGVSCTVESTGGGEGETASLTVHPDGSVTVIVGTSPHGQGHETTFADVVMAELGIDRSRIAILHGDTDLSPYGGGTIGSRSAQLGGSAAFGAALDAIETARLRAAELLEANPADVEFNPAVGQFHVVGTPARALSWADVGQIEVTHHFKPERGAATFAFGACLAVVEVDTEIGAVSVRSLLSVDDAGTLLQPTLAEGQVHGGLGLAIGAVLCEEMIYDGGVPRSGNFADYGLVSAAEMPSFHTEEMETPSPLNPLGVKGVGESGTVVATPALQSAVIDALSPFGITHLDLPHSPARVWAAILAARSPTDPTVQERRSGPVRLG